MLRKNIAGRLFDFDQLGITGNFMMDERDRGLIEPEKIGGYASEPFSKGNPTIIQTKTPEEELIELAEALDLRQTPLQRLRNQLISDTDISMAPSMQTFIAEAIEPHIGDQVRLAEEANRKFIEARNKILGFATETGKQTTTSTTGVELREKPTAKTSTRSSKIPPIEEEEEEEEEIKIEDPPEGKQTASELSIGESFSAFLKGELEGQSFPDEYADSAGRRFLERRASEGKTDEPTEAEIKEHKARTTRILDMINDVIGVSEDIDKGTSDVDEKIILRAIHTLMQGKLLEKPSIIRDALRKIKERRSSIGVSPIIPKAKISSPPSGGPAKPPPSGGPAKSPPSGGSTKSIAISKSESIFNEFIEGKETKFVDKYLENSVDTGKTISPEAEAIIRNRLNRIRDAFKIIETKTTGKTKPVLSKDELTILDATDTLKLGVIIFPNLGVDIALDNFFSLHKKKPKAPPPKTGL